MDKHPCRESIVTIFTAKFDRGFLHIPFALLQNVAVFESTIGNPPKELSLPFDGRNSCLNCSPREMAETFRSWRSDATLYNLSNGNFLALSHENENLVQPRSIVVIDEISCLFSGALFNTRDLRRHYGLARQATEAMVIVEAYKVLRDRAPYPADQVVKQLHGSFAFILFDSKDSTLFLARDGDGRVQFHWGTASDGSLVCSDDPNVISVACGNCYTPFPPGCFFINKSGLMSFDHPLHKVVGIPQVDNHGHIHAVIFQVDLFTRLHSIPRTGSATNWAGAAIFDGTNKSPRNLYKREYIDGLEAQNRRRHERMQQNEKMVLYATGRWPRRDGVGFLFRFGKRESPAV